MMSSRVGSANDEDEARETQRAGANEGSAKPDATPAPPDVKSDRSGPTNTHKKPLPIDEIENIEDDAKGG